MSLEWGGMQGPRGTLGICEYTTPIQTKKLFVYHSSAMYNTPPENILALCIYRGYAPQETLIKKKIAKEQSLYIIPGIYFLNSIAMYITQVLTNTYYTPKIDFCQENYFYIS